MSEVNVNGVRLTAELHEWLLRFGESEFGRDKPGATPATLIMHAVYDALPVEAGRQ